MGHKEEIQYKAEMKQLLHLIIHSLYTHPEVFLRELISNASDALNKVRFRQLTDKAMIESDGELRISLSVDEKKKTFSISDNGIGMNREDLINNIGTIARSGTLEFIEKMKEAKTTGTTDQLIGQFGVGFYSVFMVTDNVIIETRSADSGSQGWRWQSQGEGSFTLEEIDRKERGTTISFIFKKDAEEFASLFTIKNIIKKYSNFVEFPVYIGEEKANAVDALWHKKTADITQPQAYEFYKFITGDSDDPLAWFHVSIEGNVNFKALLFIPSHAPADFYLHKDDPSLSLYCNKIMIQDDCKELTPEYLRFVKGVVDTEDLPLNVSREVTQNSPAMSKINKIVTTKILAFLDDLSRSDAKKYEEIHTKFGPLFKSGIHTDFINRDKLINLMRFESSKYDRGTLHALKDYASRMHEKQKEIYYLSGENRSIIEQNPALEIFTKHAIEVLFVTLPVDIWLMPSIHEYDKKPLKPIDKADIDFINELTGTVEKPDIPLNQSLLTLFKETLKDKVGPVVSSKRLVSSPVVLVGDKNSMDPQFEKMMKMVNKDFEAGKKVLEVNFEHPLLKNLAKLYLANKHTLVATCIEQLYDSALLLDGSLQNPAEFIKRMTDIMLEATDK